MVWFDPEKGYERELRYATNQKSIFVDEQQGQSTLKHIVFSNGHLIVPKEKRKQVDRDLLIHHLTSIAKKSIQEIRNIEWRLKNAIK